MLTVVSGRILVIDDDPDWGLIVRKILGPAGNEVVTATRGSDGLALLKREQFDIVIVDIILPDALGIDLIPRIHADHPDTAIYVLSGHSAAYSAASALQQGAERYIDKSIEPDALREMVEHTLERRRLLRSLHAERERYEQLVANAPIGVFTIDARTLQFSFANRFLLELTGYTSEELLGHTPLEFIRSEDSELLKERLRARIDGSVLPSGDKVTYSFKKKDGSTIIMQVETHLVEENGERFIEGTARDATLEVRISQLQQTVISVGQSILASGEIDRILQSVLDAIVEQSGFQRAVATLYDLSSPNPEEGEAYKTLAAGLSDDDLESLHSGGAMTATERRMAFAERFRMGDAYYIPHDRTPWSPDLGLSGSVSFDGWDPDDFLFIPLRGSEGIIGHISIDDPVDRAAPTVDTLKPVVALANLAALAVERTYRFSQLEKQKRRLHGLAQFSRELAAAQDIEMMCHLAAKRLQRDMGYEFCDIFIRDEDELVLLGSASQGDYAEENVLYIGLRMPLSGPGFIRWAFENGKEVIVPDVRKEKGYLKWSDLTRSEIDIPILTSKEVLGVINVESARVSAFGEQDREIITALASQLGVAIMNLKRHTSLFQMQGLANMLVGATSVDELVASTLDFLREQYSLQRSVILLREGDELVVRAVRNPSGESGPEIGRRLHLGEGIVGWVAEHNAHALVGDVTDDPRYVEGFPGTRSEVAVPVIISDEVLGVLTVESTQVGAFDDEDRQLLTSAAAQLAVALSNLLAQQRLREQAIRDPLTGLFNRHYLNEVIDGELDRADRYGREITLMMLDIDGFRCVNNTLGHLKGDEVLQRVADVLQAGVRAADRVIRYGGDEFLIFMPETLDDAGLVEQRLKSEVAALATRLGIDGIGLSIGTYVRRAGDDLPIEQILARADRLMYEDKRRTYASREQGNDYRY